MDIADIKLIDGESRTLEDVVISFKPLILFISKKQLKYAYKFGLEFDDLISYGYEGLIKAYNRFESERGLKFMTYAFPLVQGEIARRVRDYGGVVKFVRAEKDLAKEIYQSDLQDLSITEICEKTGRNRRGVVTALALIKGASVSLTKKVSSADDKNSTIADLIEVNTDFSAIVVNDFLSTLPAKLKTTLELLMQDKVQQEVAEIMGCSQVQVSRQLCKIRELYKEWRHEG